MDKQQQEPDYSELPPLELWIEAARMQAQGEPIPTDLLANLDRHGWDTRAFR